MNTDSERQNFGWEVGPSEYGPRGIIARPETSAVGNVVLQVGNESEGGGWFKVAHVVLTPTEAAEFYAILGEQIGTSESS